ncbi:hypothetical protein NEMBOFW57_008311 [Staphylotrichum longicolle]|uniref:Xylanolytic transcriptional activator regulatory domain-containing protein n=1 Tax=Staphylotrichum longicolle TaxID=669026 RepID=A0AAD4ERJ0_9PEZI|nr:hypothetical protein NEMBOFW57_008311 [Staphylotrichum longicolle]
MSATAALAATARQPQQSARPGRRNGSMSTLVPAPPLPRGTTHAAAREPPQQQETSGSASEGARQRLEESRTSSSRASPVLGVAEIQGQVLDSTSGLTFLHRAWKRLSQPNRQHESRDDTGLVPQAANHSIEQQPIFAVGDRPLPSDNADDEDATGGVDARLWFPDHARAHELLVLYFDVCIATYRLLHRPTVEGWLEAVEGNLARGRALHDGIGRAKTAVLLSALAIATTHHEKSRGFITVEDEARSLARSDRLFCEGTRLSSHEKGLLRLESAQARLVQVLYLLTTSRPNRAWYVFGEALQIVSALGLHRRASRKLPLAPGSQKPDYIQSQCLKRTFWTAYILDHYLGIILGRPRHFHDEDIDQELPDAINDEDMRADVSLSRADTNVDCHLDALIFHARIAQIIGKITREVYTIRPISEQERVSAAHRLCERLHSWKASLPPHLGAVRPSTLIPSFRRQCIVLRIAYSHAIMHANRFFLLGNFSSRSSEMQVAECIRAAKTVLEIVDGLARDSPIFHAFWWTHYVSFCALVVTYVWEIRQQQIQRDASTAAGAKTPPVDRTALLDLAERCQMHLAQATATNSPSRRYAIILEELRSEAQQQQQQQPGRGTVANTAGRPEGNTVPEAEREGPRDHTVVLQCEQNLQPFHVNDISVHGFAPAMLDPADSFGSLPGNPIFETWNMTDWLDLDSSVRCSRFRLIF